MNWRLLLDGAATGAWNMAVDEALLIAHGARQTPPTIRFYDWQPACVSLGRFQKNKDGAASSFIPQSSSFDVVRRPTGGRAVLHQHEITYCAVVHEELLPAEAHSVVGAYRWLSQGLILGLQELGVAANLARQAPPATAPSRAAPVANCFASVALCDFVVGERKLIGAAQCRKHGAVLQHGSLLLDIDQRAWQSTLGGSMNATASLRDLGLDVPRPTIIAALCRGLEQALGAVLSQDGLSEAETLSARRLYQEKYTQRAWNCDGLSG